MAQILHLLMCAALECAPSLKSSPDEQNLLLGAVYGLLKGSTLLLKCSKVLGLSFVWLYIVNGEPLRTLNLLKSSCFGYLSS